MEIFISHASADGVLAADIGEGVRQAGHGIFLDTDPEDGIAPSADWQRTLFRELRACDAVVFLNSKAGQASKWCHSELVVAAEPDRTYDESDRSHHRAYPAIDRERCQRNASQRRDLDVSKPTLTVSAW